jgi:hypothetical protein
MEKNTLNSNWKKLVVRVFVREGNIEKFRGTAFLINDEYLLTAKHVIKDFLQNYDQICLKNGPVDGTLFLVEPAIPHPNLDIALLRLKMPIDGETIEYYPLQNATLTGQSVFIAGFENEHAPSSASSFEVLEKLNQYSAYVLQNKSQHGKSGSPVIFQNKIVGIFFARSDANDPRQDQNQSLIYPFSVFEDFLNDKGVNLPRPDTESGSLHPVSDSKGEVLTPSVRVAQINRQSQWNDHIEQRLKKNETRKIFAFVVAGVNQEWPQAFQFRFCHHLKLKPEPRNYSITPTLREWNRDSWKQIFWHSFLECLPIKDLQETDLEDQLKVRLQIELSRYPSSLFFSYDLDDDMVKDKNLDFIQYIVKSWESLELSSSSCQHVLLIVYGDEETDNVGFWSKLKSIFKREKQGEQKVKKWRENLAKRLGESSKPDSQNPRIVLPILEPIRRAHINEWKEDLPIMQQVAFEKYLTSTKNSHISHRTLRNEYLNITDKSKS